MVHAPSPAQEIPAWQQINELFEHHGLPPPPWRLRDVLVRHLITYEERQEEMRRALEGS